MKNEICATCGHSIESHEHSSRYQSQDISYCDEYDCSCESFQFEDSGNWPEFVEVQQ